MWGKNEGPVQAAKEPGPPPPAPPVAPLPEQPKAARAVHSEPKDGNSAGRAIIGKSLVLKAQISGSEDLFIDGELEGSVELRDHNLVVGANGKVDANVVARNVTVHGTLRGNVQASEKVEIRTTGSIVGDLTTAGVTIEDGAYFKGSIDIVRPGKPEARA